MSIAPPIVASEAGDICVYTSVRDAERAMEAIDVRGGIYEVFDSEGRQLDIGIRITEQAKMFWCGTTRLEWVAITEGTTGTAGSIKLRALLAAAIATSDPDARVDGLSLQDLISKVAGRPNL